MHVLADRRRRDRVLRALEHPERVEFFEIPDVPVASRDLRARLEAGEPLEDRVPVEVERLIEAEINAAIDPQREPPLRLLVIDTTGNGARGQGVLVLTWFHPLMDPRGGQNLLAQLSTLDTNGVHDGGLAQEATRDPRPFRERGRIARTSLAYMKTLAPVAPVSPGAALTTPSAVRYRQVSFVEGDSGLRQTREISWRLAVVGKALAELSRQLRSLDAFGVTDSEYAQFQLGVINRATASVAYLAASS